MIKKKNSNSSGEVKVLAQHICMSVFKAQRVIDQIRGRSYEETLMILELMPYRASYPILKLVYSAAANASHNMGKEKELKFEWRSKSFSSTYMYVCFQSTKSNCSDSRAFLCGNAYDIGTYALSSILSLLKLVYSAAANASHNMGLNETDLFISKAEVNGGPFVKKLRPRARGRSYPIKRPTCHITIVLKDKSKLSFDEFKI
uniref:Large ribosomal subunit protein uL22c n=1 Tax=Allium tuberosum TaxID=4683 RepID=A0A6M8TT62_ALLTU|nr:ribosomal protein L22 [Allium tuberosum]